MSMDTPRLDRPLDEIIRDTAKPDHDRRARDKGRDRRDRDREMRDAPRERDRGYGRDRSPDDHHRADRRRARREEPYPTAARAPPAQLPLHPPPRQPAASVSSPLTDAERLASRVIKVSSQSNPRSVAGSIAHISREGDPPLVLAVGPASINQALKAVAIARKYLESEKIAVCCQPRFKRDSDIQFCLVLSLQKHPLRQQAEPVNQFTVMVRKDSEPAKVAGAIAGKVREGLRVSVSCVTLGQETVFVSIEAIAKAREFLARDAMDVTVWPEFESRTREDATSSALRLDLRSCQV